MHPKNVRAFFCEPTGRERRFLRRYVSSADAKCPGPHGYHTARALLLDYAETNDASRSWPHDDPRWPVKCAGCDYVFQDSDKWQVFPETIYRRSDTGAEILRSENVPGMMWDAPWMSRKGSDGRSIHVVLPNGKEWGIDQVAKNCTMPNDNVHRCWIRHGVIPHITVDKAGVTCKAGGGSIQAGDYHGFLRNGVFEP